MSLFGGDVFASLDDLPYRQGSTVDDSDSDTISSASSEEENYDEGDNNDEDNVSCEEEDTELEDDHEEETTKPWLSAEKVLRDGLIFIRYKEDSINRCGKRRNINRFKACYGVGPNTASRFFRDLFERYPSLEYRNVFIAMNWLKTYQTMHVMTAMWGDCEEVIAPMVEEYVEKFASLKESKIRLDRFKDEPIIVFSIDNVHFSVEEFALDPSNKWFNHKQGGAGLKYEVAISIHTQEVMWIRGPLPCSVHDISMFRGGTKEDKKKNKIDKDAFIFQIPDGKRGVGDSGYSGEPTKIITTRKGQSMELKKWLGRVKSRQETFFTRMKGFAILKNRFRHGKRGTADKMNRHKSCVESIAVIIAYDLHDQPLFEV